MTMKKLFGTLVFTVTLAATAAPVDFIGVLTHTNGTLVAPTNFFEANRTNIYEVFANLAGPGGTNSPNFIQATNIAQAQIAALAPATNEFWISTTGTNGNGRSAVTPFVVTNSAQFQSLMQVPDNLWPAWPVYSIPTNPVIPIGSVIHLSPGVFWVKNGFDPQDGWDIEGSGRGITILRFDNNKTNVLSSDTLIGYRGQFLYGYRKNLTIRNLTFDINAQNQTNQCADGAFYFSGQNSLVQHCDIINWGNTRTDSVEEFLGNLGGLGGNYYGENAETNFIGNCVMDDVVIGPPAQIQMHDGVTGLIIGGSGYYYYDGTNSNVQYPASSTPTNGWVIGGQIKNCSISYPVKIGLGTNGQPKYFHFTSFGGFGQGLKIINNTVASGSGVTGAYFEDGLQLDAAISANIFLDGYPVLWNQNEGFNHSKGLTITGNLLRFGNANNGISISSTQQTNPVENIVITGNDIAPRFDATSPGNGLLINVATNVTVNDNIVDSGGAIGHGDVRLYTNNALASIKFFQNRNLNSQFPTFDNSSPGIMTNLPDLIAAQNFAGDASMTSNSPNATVTSSNLSLLVATTRNASGSTNYDLSAHTYYARLNSDFLVNSNFVNGGSSNTNSPASVVLPAGFYELSAVIQAYPDTGTVPMAVGISFSSANSAYVTSISGAPNGSSVFLATAFGNTQANFAFGSSTPSSGLVWNQFGTFYLSAQKTVYLCGSLQAANTNSFKIRTGSYVSFRWLSSSP